MAEPGDPNTPDGPTPGNPAPGNPAPVAHRPPAHGTHDHSHDDLIGFTSPASLTGRERPSLAVPPPTPPPAPLVEAEPDLFDPQPFRASTAVEPNTPRDPAPAPPPAAPPERVLDFDHLARTATRVPADPSTLPSWAQETAPIAPSSRRREAAAFGRASTARPIEGSMGLYAVYALILFAVPTLGVSALVALLAVTGRPGPDEPLSHSHFVFQQRTLWIAAIAAGLGVVLIAVNLGVFVLFIMAVWVVVRGAVGLLALTRGKAIANPRTVLI